MAVRRNRPSMRVRQRMWIWGRDGYAVPLPLQFRASVIGCAVIGCLLTPFLRTGDSPLFGLAEDLVSAGPLAAVSAVVRATCSALTGRIVELDEAALAELLVNVSLATGLGLAAAMVVRPRSPYTYLWVWAFAAAALMLYSAIIEPAPPPRSGRDGRFVAAQSDEPGSSFVPPGTLVPILADTPATSIPPSRTEPSTLAATATPVQISTPTAPSPSRATSTPTVTTTSLPPAKSWLPGGGEVAVRVEIIAPLDQGRSGCSIHIAWNGPSIPTTVYATRYMWSTKYSVASGARVFSTPCVEPGHYLITVCAGPVGDGNCDQRYVDVEGFNQ